MYVIRQAEKRGYADFGWLQSYHSFSFGRYYDPEQLAHGQLLVINDDRVKPGKGFATHGHRNMEILSYVLSGTMTHQDSMGHQYSLPAGEFQLMSAGKGVTHSEFNPSAEQSLHFLQIWIQPNELNTEPEYQQNCFDGGAERLIFSPDGEQGSLTIRQQAWLRRIRLQTGEAWLGELIRTDKAYIHIVAGELQLDGHQLGQGDGVKLQAETPLEVKASQNSEFLLFEV